MRLPSSAAKAPTGGNLVSILVPTFNRENLIEETLHSALAQTHSNIEVVVVDNASTDQSWEIINRLAAGDARIRAFRNRDNLGPMRNWKRCFDEARGDFGKILWSDDLISSDFVEKTLPFLEDPETGFAFSSAREFEGEKTICVRYRFGATGFYPTDGFIRKSLLYGDCPYSPGCALFRMDDLRESLEVDIPNRIGASFSQLAIGNDVLLFLNTAVRYRKFAYVNEPLAQFRHHSGSITVGSPSRQIYYSIAKCNFALKHVNDPRLLDRFFAILQIFAVFARMKYPLIIKSKCDLLPPFFRWPVRRNIKLLLWAAFRILTRLSS